jgi:DNA-binding XRE family transcriptional regulator
MKNTLEFLMETRGITKAQLAKDLGVTRQTINNIVKGNAPSMEVGLKLGKYFDKDVSDIFYSPDVKHVARNNKKITA